MFPGRRIGVGTDFQNEGTDFELVSGDELLFGLVRPLAVDELLCELAGRRVTVLPCELTTVLALDRLGILLMLGNNIFSRQIRYGPRKKDVD